MKVFKDIRTYIVLFGVLTSVLLHELFHVAVHWGNIQSIRFFPDTHAVIEIIATVPHGYTVQTEEFIAYGITVATILITIGLIWKVSDARSSRTFSQTALPKWSELHQLEAHELYELALKTKAFDSRI
jgi:hypothetical protein